TDTQPAGNRILVSSFSVTKQAVNDYLTTLPQTISFGCFKTLRLFLSSRTGFHAAVNFIIR
ncbi:MAG: hypothetical protein ACP5VS_07610, partial [Desulfomonilaceae bacterium]